MKSITLMAVAISASLFFACQKRSDLPRLRTTTDLCQVTRIESVYANGDPGRYFNYMYDSLGLDSLNGGPTSTPYPVVKAHIEYDSLHLPVLVNVGNWLTTWQYQNNRVHKIISFGYDWFTYNYDTTGRVIRRDSPIDTIWYQYSDNSRNFTKRTFRQSQGPASDSIVINYQYDNKINPLSQWPNFPLNPFVYELIDTQERVFEPIPENNWTYSASKSNGFTFQEVFYTYTYNNNYPATAQLQWIAHSPSTPDVEKLINTTYTYDCPSESARYSKKLQ